MMVLLPGSCILNCLTGVTRASWRRSKKACLLYFNRDSIEISPPSVHDLECWLSLSLWRIWHHSSIHFIPGPSYVTLSHCLSPVSSLLNLECSYSLQLLIGIHISRSLKIKFGLTDALWWSPSCNSWQVMAVYQVDTRCTDWPAEISSSKSAIRSHQAELQIYIQCMLQCNLHEH